MVAISVCISVWDVEEWGNESVFRRPQGPEEEQEFFTPEEETGNRNHTQKSTRKVATPPNLTNSLVHQLQRSFDVVHSYVPANAIPIYMPLMRMNIIYMAYEHYFSGTRFDMGGTNGKGGPDRKELYAHVLYLVFLLIHGGDGDGGELAHRLGVFSDHHLLGLGGARHLEQDGQGGGGINRGLLHLLVSLSINQTDTSVTDTRRGIDHHDIRTTTNRTNQLIRHTK